MECAMQDDLHRKLLLTEPAIKSSLIFSYMLKDKEVGKKHLDIALDDYFKGKGKAKPAAAAADEAAMQS
jgi:hypothetical protein